MDDGFYDRATLIGSSVCSPVGLNEGLVPPLLPPGPPRDAETVKADKLP